MRPLCSVCHRPIPLAKLGKIPSHIDGKEDRQLLHEVIVILKEYGEKLNLHLPVLDSMLKAQQSQEQKDKATTEVMLQLMDATNKLSAKIDAIDPKPKPSVWLRMKNAIKRLMTTNK